ncbi:MAG: DUF2959 family protein [Planctomycetes bacterium]|nr:DUF2959 family protein [Planctomycetota bacterium]
MRQRHLILSIALGLPFLAGVSACSVIPGLSSKKSDGLDRVDELLGRVEQVQAESVLSKERAEEALGMLQEVSAPDFAGNPVAAYAELLSKIEASKKQATKLGESIAPLKETAEDVFTAWTASLESFGNTKLRRQSHVRLAETRARCDAILSSATAAHIAYESLNADLRDHALFLEHDFNAASVAVVAEQLDTLDAQTTELCDRLDSTVAASKSYIETSALRGQLAVNGSEVKSAPRAAPEEGKRRRARAAENTEEAVEGVPVAKKSNTRPR